MQQLAWSSSQACSAKPQTLHPLEPLAAAVQGLLLQQQAALLTVPVPMLTHSQVAVAEQLPYPG